MATQGAQHHRATPRGVLRPRSREVEEVIRDTKTTLDIRLAERHHRLRAEEGKLKAGRVSKLLFEIDEPCREVLRGYDLMTSRSLLTLSSIAYRLCIAFLGLIRQHSAGCLGSLRIWSLFLRCEWINLSIWWFLHGFGDLQRVILSIFHDMRF